jgi:hypothetical protein
MDVRLTGSKADLARALITGLLRRAAIEFLTETGKMCSPIRQGMENATFDTSMEPALIQFSVC